MEEQRSKWWVIIVRKCAYGRHFSLLFEICRMANMYEVPDLGRSRKISLAKTKFS
jgi:hypothetical protein